MNFTLHFVLRKSQNFFKVNAVLTLMQYYMTLKNKQNVMIMVRIVDISRKRIDSNIHWEGAGKNILKW